MFASSASQLNDMAKPDRRPLWDVRCRLKNRHSEEPGCGRPDVKNDANLQERWRIHSRSYPVRGSCSETLQISDDLPGI